MFPLMQGATILSVTSRNDSLPEAGIEELLSVAKEEPSKLIAASFQSFKLCEA
jgi:hypothetical protein